MICLKTDLGNFSIVESSTVKIATLICMYRGDCADHAREALRSVIDQKISADYKSNIYLGVDGELTSELEEVVEEFKDDLFLIFRSTGNQGLASTLNELISRLNDEKFIFRMDADDVSHLDRFQTQLNHMAANPDIDILGTAIVEFSSDSSFKRRIVNYCRDSNDAVANIHKRVPVAHPTVCFRRRVLQVLGGYPVVGTNEDIALWFKCVEAGFKFGNVPGVYLSFRISEKFWNRRSWRKAASEFKSYVLGIYSIWGPFTFRFGFPILRFLVRLSPKQLSKYAYKSRFRNLN